ncbi:MAG: 2-amino-4-hydroxy-6-hydroxymethyldihydropteridine diphosphokinase [Chloroflexi bacterium]|nr:2-amino-4-hydroxy-6-hydroxymethyldihydropteridine diphosphokinase [Chloroflexota bacterium]
MYLALGTNLGDRFHHLQQAVSLLAPEVHVRRISPVYQTPPWGYLDQPDFLNQALEAATDLAPEALLRYLKAIEKEMGREKVVRNGPRIIDLDILFYDDLILKTEDLQIPHWGVAQRAFVLEPLADLAPELRHPQTGRTVEEMLAGVDRSGVTLFWRPDRDHPERME